MLVPPFFGRHLFPVTEQVIHENNRSIQRRDILDHMKGHSMQPVREILVPGTYPDTVAALTAVSCPELKALFSIDVPFHDAPIVGFAGAFSGGRIS